MNHRCSDDVYCTIVTCLIIFLFVPLLQRVAQNRRSRQPGHARSAQARRAEDLPGVLGRGLGMPLRGGHLWELQGVLQEGRGRFVRRACALTCSSLPFFHRHLRFVCVTRSAARFSVFPCVLEPATSAASPALALQVAASVSPPSSSTVNNSMIAPLPGLLN